MSHGLHHYIPSLLFFLNIFRDTTSFSTSHTQISFNRKSLPTRETNVADRKHLSSLGLALNPNDFANQMNRVDSANNHIQQVVHEKVVTGNTKRSYDVGSDFSFLVADSLFGGKRDTYPIGTAIKPTDSQSYLASIPAEGVAASKAREGDRQFALTEAGALFEEPEYDEQALEFYTKEAVAFAKLPLAAVIYASFEFFFMNQKRQQDMYYRDEYDLDEDEEQSQMIEFGGMLLLRIGAAFALTILTLALS
mmetsp:Transcript_33695/g.41300  ORF Transcript_33695/g.41300 Transcript_33695/m.41300 type:complete len:250 (-) Transcript_33695:99-848(-)